MLNCNYFNLSHIINSHTCIIKCNPSPPKKNQKKKKSCYFDNNMSELSQYVYYALVCNVRSVTIYRSGF